MNFIGRAAPIFFTGVHDFDVAICVDLRALKTIRRKLPSTAGNLKNRP